MENKINNAFNTTVIGDYLRPFGIAGSIALAILFGASPISADNLYVGGSFTTGIQMLVNGSSISEGGGSIDPSSLNGVPLAFVYCIDLFTQVQVGQNYPGTEVTNNGFVERPVPGIVQGAGAIAYLVNAYGAAGQNSDFQRALQAAIWTFALNGITLNNVVQSVQLDQNYYNNNNNNDIVNDYTTFINDGLAHVSYPAINALWLSPSVDGVTFAQSLVTAVPEPGTYLMLGSFLGLGALYLVRQRRSLA